MPCIISSHYVSGWGHGPGLMAREARFVVWCFTDKLSTEWGKPKAKCWAGCEVNCCLPSCGPLECAGEVEEWRWHGGWGRSGFDDALVRN